MMTLSQNVRSAFTVVMPSILRARLGTSSTTYGVTVAGTFGSRADFAPASIFTAERT